MSPPALDRLLGAWTTEASHPAMPGVVVHGTVDVEWLEGERFLVHRARTDHDAFPDSLSVLGVTAADRVHEATGETVADVEEPPMTMHYFDSRGVFRVYEVAVDDTGWRIWRDAPGFSQRFTGTFADGGATVEGRWQLRRDDTWEDDLVITYRRVSPGRRE